jgi:hypothetical protein
MMSKAKEIKNLIEGFKLGKLGASRSGRFSLDPDFVKIVVFKTLVPSGQYLPGCKSIVTWEESNGYVFVAGMFSVTKEYQIQILAGRDLKMPSSEIDQSTPLTDEFRLRHDYKFSDADEAVSFFKEILDSIKKAGSFGEALTTGKIGSGWKVFKSGFSEYLNDNKKLKSPYFRIE